MRSSLIRSLLLLVALAVGNAAARAPAGEPFEVEPTQAAADLVQPGLLSGPGYRVGPQAPLVGFMARFTLYTDGGPILAESVEMLELRAAEMAAIEILDDTNLLEAYGVAVRERLQDSAETVARVVTQPVDTVVGLPAGVMRYFGRQLERWDERVSRQGDRIAWGARNDGDPYDMTGPMNAGREQRPNKPRRRWYGSAGREVGRQVEDYVKHSRARRMLARELGIDPYVATSNPLLNARLDRLAWAAAAGSMTVGEALGRLPQGGREVLDQTGRLDELVWELEPENLRARNREVLERWCGDDFQIRRFSRHRAFPASVQTRFASALEQLRPVDGCEHLLDLALAARHEIEGRFLANALVMANDFHGPAAEGSALRVVGAGLLLELPDGRRVLPLPIDRLSWTALAEDFFRQPELAEGPRTVLVAGEMSDRALRELTTLGWDIVVRTPFAGAPAYARGCCA